MANLNDLIFKQNMIDDNYALAVNIIPESFVPTKMLYIKGKINSQELEIFVDTGAQVSIMSLALAKKLGIDYLIDHFCEGKLVGIGVKEMVGKIHYTDIQFGNFNLPTGFTIIDDDNTKIMLGLNTMLSTGCVLDLKNKKMIFNGCEIKFLNY